MSLKGPRRSLDRGLPLTSAAGPGGVRLPTDRGLSLPNAAGPGGVRLLTRVTALALLCLTAFTLLEVVGLAHWSLGLKRTGACQADNEVRPRPAAHGGGRLVLQSEYCGLGAGS